MSARDQLMEDEALKALPEIREFRRVLYVGGKVGGTCLLQLFAAAQVWVIEAWPPNVAALRQAKDLRLAGVILGDVLHAAEVPEIAALVPFHAVAWIEGPEHVEQAALERFIGPAGAVHSLYTRAILLGCPFGRYVQGPAGGNPYEVHRSYLLPEFFERLGYEVATVGEPDTPSAHITSWRRTLI